MQVRCPYCSYPIELVERTDLAEIACPSCGSSFNLLDDSTLPHQKETRKTIAQFELLEQVGVGAFGSVWKARDLELDRTVAIKIPRKGQLDSAEASNFFEKRVLRPS
jgi:serine/threonine protein kinase